MTYAVEIRDVALDDLDGIPGNIRSRILRAIEKRLVTAPDKYGERLARDLSGLWKLRVGDYRIAYEIDARARKVSIWAIRDRRDVYPETLRRLRRP